MQIDQTRRWVGIIRNLARSAPLRPPLSTTAGATPGTQMGAGSSVAGSVVDSGTKTKVLGSEVASNSSGNMTGLEQVIASRVAAIDRDSPQRERHAFRVFLESVLLDEFGMELMSDAGFAPWVEQVLQRMETDPALSVAIHEAGAWLLAAPDAKSG